jgi:hypothetical protein
VKKLPIPSFAKYIGIVIIVIPCAIPDIKLAVSSRLIAD